MHLRSDVIVDECRRPMMKSPANLRKGSAPFVGAHFAMEHSPATRRLYIS